MAKTSPWGTPKYNINTLVINYDLLFTMHSKQWICEDSNPNKLWRHDLFAWRCSIWSNLAHLCQKQHKTEIFRLFIRKQLLFQVCNIVYSLYGLFNWAKMHYLWLCLHSSRSHLNLTDGLYLNFDGLYLNFDGLYLNLNGLYLYYKFCRWDLL